MTVSGRWYIVNQIKEGLAGLAKQEQAESMLKYGLFNSNHEAYAILKEELEEMLESSNQSLEIFSLIWGNVKTDCLAQSDLRALHLNLIHTGAELVQCLAMINKWLLLYEDPRVEESKG